MKRIILSAAMLLVAGVASAQTIQDFPSGASASGSAIISNSNLAYNAGDSSSVLSVGALKNLKLLIKCTPAAGADLDTVNTTRLAVQIRTHLNAATDSASTFVEYPLGSTNLGVASGAADSATVGQLFKGGRNNAWSGEFVVLFQNIRKAHASSIAVNGHDWYWPNGVAVPLASLFGREFYADHVSVRVRNMSGNACAVTVNLVGQR